MPQFELVLPCYNEEKSLHTIASRAITAARQDGLTSDQFKLVLVENGSKDNSRAVLDEMLKDPNYSPWIKVVKIDLNQGYGFGIHQGLSVTTAGVVGWSHADQQCDPQDAFRAYRTLAEVGAKPTLIKGKRFGRSFKEIIVSRVFETIATILLGKPFFEVNAQPKVFKRELLQKVTQPPKDFAFDLYVLYVALKNGYAVKTIDVSFPPRIHGLSNWANSMRNRTKHISNMIKYIWDLSRSQGRL